jgi:signal transduction histidine kinase/CheY-like chemotaxis protein
MTADSPQSAGQGSVAEQLRLEKELQAQTERLLLGQRSAGMIIIDWNVVDDELRWSDSPERVRGPLPADGKYPVWTEQDHPDDREHFLARREEGIRTLQPTTCEYRIVRTDGRLTWLHAVQTAFAGADGRAERVIISVQDITERKHADEQRARLEMQLRESQKMEALGTLAGGVAHDFNNIIATILGHTELARHDAGANPQTIESIAEIGKAARRARDLVYQILSFSRREQTHRKRVDLAAVLEDSARLLRATLPGRVTLQVHCDAGVPGVLADTTQIQQVLINLANNAVHAMHGQAGRIEFRLDTVMLDAHWMPAHPALSELCARHPGAAARIVVRDNGQGMDAATLARIYEPFFTTKPPGEGTGLGLAVVHGIVLAHQGAIEADSAPNQGATFAIYLPLAPAQAEDPAPHPREANPAVAPQGGGRRSILYVDDDEPLVLLVKRLLERRGFQVSAHGSQSEALDMLRANPGAFDLLVTDYNMPGMSGLDVACAARAIRPDLPVAIASGFIDETLRAQAAGAGVRELIFKPAAVDDLCAVVEAVLRKAGAS